MAVGIDAMAQTETDKCIADILSIKPRGKNMTEVKAKKKRSCIEISVGVFMVSMMFLTSITTGAAVYTVMQAAQLSEARAQLYEAKEIINHLMGGGKKDGKKGVGYTMRHSREAIIHAAATCGQEYNVRPDLLLAIWRKESRHDAWAINADSRAAGIGQILPSNYPELINAGVIEQPADLLLDLTKAACASAYYLADYTRRGRGDAWATQAYYSGPGRVHEGMEYSQSVMRYVTSGEVHP